MTNRTSPGDEVAALTRSELADLAGMQLRIECNKIRRVLDELDPQTVLDRAEQASLDPMSKDEAEAYGKEQMGFGQYAICQRRDVPREYLDWLVEAKRMEWKQLLRYMKTLPE